MFYNYSIINKTKKNLNKNPKKCFKFNNQNKRKKKKKEKKNTENQTVKRSIGLVFSATEKPEVVRSRPGT